MKRKNFKLVYMVPKGTDEIIKERDVRTFQVDLSNDKIKESVFEGERAAGHFPLEFIFKGTDNV
jgi:hypothetical protein